MLVSSGKLMLAFCAALILAGCQSTVTPLAVAAVSSIEAAGFQAVSSLAPVTGSPGNSAQAAFVCPAQRCGAITALVLATVLPSNTNPNMTIEQGVRGNLLNQAGVRALLEKAILSKISETNPGVAGKMMSYSINTKAATQKFSARLTAPDGKPAYIAGFSRFVGNETRSIVAISASPAIAARYARPDWLN